MVQIEKEIVYFNSRIIQGKMILFLFINSKTVISSKKESTERCRKLCAFREFTW
jgi:hypothetical protein